MAGMRTNRLLQTHVWETIGEASYFTVLYNSAKADTVCQVPGRRVVGQTIDKYTVVKAYVADDCEKGK